MRVGIEIRLRCGVKRGNDNAFRRAFGAVSFNSAIGGKASVTTVY
jgi:hypothetical protein